MRTPVVHQSGTRMRTRADTGVRTGADTRVDTGLERTAHAAVCLHSDSILNPCAHPRAQGVRQPMDYHVHKVRIRCALRRAPGLGSGSRRPVLFVIHTGVGRQAPSSCARACTPVCEPDPWRHERGDSEFQALDQFRHRDLVMRGDTSKDAAQSSNLDRAMVGNDFVVLATHQGRHPEMGSRLACYCIAQNPERLGKVGSGKVPRRLHRARTSSRTKCRRIIAGAVEGSSK